MVVGMMIGNRDGDNTRRTKTVQEAPQSAPQTACSEERDAHESYMGDRTCRPCDILADINEGLNVYQEVGLTGL